MKPKIKTLYYKVPECPQCGSRRTGRYLKQPMFQDDAIYIEAESLKNGELIRFMPKEPIKNCYCEECEFEWGHTVHASLVTREEKEKEMDERGTRMLYLTFIKDHPHKKKSIFKKIFGLFPW